MIITSFVFGFWLIEWQDGTELPVSMLHMLQWNCKFGSYPSEASSERDSMVL